MSSSGELAQLKSDGNWIKKKTGFYLRRHKNAGTDHVPHDETDAVKEGNLLLQLHAAALGRRVRLRHHPEADVVPSPDSTREGNKDGSDRESGNQTGPTDDEGEERAWTARWESRSRSQAKPQDICRSDLHTDELQK